MKLTTYLENLEQLDQFDLSEAILGNRYLSRFGQQTVDETVELIQACKQKGIRSILEWDVLMTEQNFKSYQSIFSELLAKAPMDAVRLQDPGAIQWIKDHFPKLPIQLILETGHHNLAGLKAWVDYLGPQLERIILSSEIPKAKLVHYKQQLDIPCEILGLGRILLFYTPRSLVSPLYTDHDDPQVQRIAQIDQKEVLGTSEESPHKGFPIIENRHGTFMFNTKELCLLDHWEELLDMQMDYFRVDLRFGKSMHWLSDIKTLTTNFDLSKVQNFKQNWPAPLIRGFFNTNKTDVLFPKLKNQRLQRQDSNYLGEVLDVVKQKYMAISIQSENLILRPGMKLIFVNPEGKKKQCTLQALMNTQGEEITSAKLGDLVCIQPLSSISVKSAVYVEA